MSHRQAYWVAFQTILVKEIKRFVRIWVQTLLPSAITTSLYFVVFGALIGSQIGEIKGFRYMEYIVPGLVLMAVISNSYANVVSSFYGTKFQRHIEEMLVAPIPNWVILAGYISGGVVRGMLVGGLVMLVAFSFTDIDVLHPWLTLAVFFLTAVLFSSAGFINAVFAKSFDDISIVPTFVLTPLIYLGGVFYSIDMLPQFWQSVSLFNPVLYMISVFRFGILGISDISISVGIAVILSFITALIWFSLLLLARGTGIKQ